MALFYRWKRQVGFTQLARCSTLPGLFAKRDFEVRFVPVAEDPQGDRVAWCVVAQGAEEVAVALHPDLAEGRDDVSLPYPGVGGRATGHDLFNKSPGVYRQVELAGVLGAQVGGQDAEVGRREIGRAH